MQIYQNFFFQTYNIGFLKCRFDKHKLKKKKLIFRHKTLLNIYL